ncbi:MAG: hypothetical protein DIZ80_05085 [endosymbiont of Galathealinum brachiosum]|uniref:Cds6 C-terminal domain-containing protein n=1 Tax=endosymbiont of Galathealinum brachiosum TaxID=2200906 RepID=A0A370DJU0_9GAMM|nr:MAG: hypothetical protein DIZ80_05085 [endosymbiont of Galathealinum brachiosum]
MDYKIFQQKLRCIFLLMVLPLSLFSVVAVANDTEIQTINSDKKLFEKAVSLYSQQQWVQAETIYRDLLKRNQQWPEPGNNLAILLLKTGRIDEAKKILEQAVSGSPGYRVTQNNRSQLYNYLATQAYDKALGSEQRIDMPELELIQEIYQPVIIVEKIIEKPVERIIVKEVIVEKTQPEIQIESAPQQTEQGSINNHIKRQLSVWSQAWSMGDFKSYIQSYSNDFLPSDARKSYAEWKNIRRARLKFTKGVNIQIEKLRVFIEPNDEYVLVEFMQNYRSETYSDRVLKQMYMHKLQDNWLILSERTIKKY